MKSKIYLIFPLLALSTLVCAQAFITPDYTLSLNHAANYYLDSTVVLGNGNLSQRIIYSYDSRERLVLKNRRDVQMNQSEVNTFNYDVNDSVVKKHPPAVKALLH